ALRQQIVGAAVREAIVPYLGSTDLLTQPAPPFLQEGEEVPTRARIVRQRGSDKLKGLDRWQNVCGHGESSVRGRMKRVYKMQLQRPVLGYRPKSCAIEMSSMHKAQV